MDYPYPVKDWRKPEEYENIKSFAWEFLRRSAAYQKDYDHVYNQANEIHAQYELTLQTEIKALQGVIDNL